MDAKAVADGDTVTVYVSTMDPRESSAVPRDVHVAAVERSKARAERNYPKADALHQKIIDSGYRFVYKLDAQIPIHRFRLTESSCLACHRVLNIQNEEILSRKYRIRLR